MHQSTAKLQVECLLNICYIYVLHYIVNAMLFYSLYIIPDSCYQGRENMSDSLLLQSLQSWKN